MLERWQVNLITRVITLTVSEVEYNLVNLNMTNVKSMTNKERVLKAISHEQPDRVPFFYWGVPGFSQKLMDHLGFTTHDELLDFLDVDFRWVEPTYVGPSLLDETSSVKKDIWGVEYKLVKNGTYHYWDVARYPLEGVKDVSALNDFPWPSTTLFDFNSLDSQIEKYRHHAIMTAPGYSSPGLFRIIQKLVGRDHFLDVMVYNPKFFKALVEQVSSFYCSFIEKFFAVAGNRVDFIRYADNLGAQRGLIINDDTWNELLLPVYERYSEIPKKLGVRFYINSCGAVRKLLPELISLGADVLGPVQTKASGMKPEGLKRDFGTYITFCGAVDEATLSRKGSPQKVRECVNELLDKMAPGGGFILGPTHKFIVETPVENVLAMYQAAKDWKY